MDILIVAKWLTDYSGREHLAPSIITQMINNVLKGGEIHGTHLLGETESSQIWLVNAILITCLICVPIMLLIKPWVLHKRHLLNALNKDYQLVSLHLDHNDN